MRAIGDFMSFNEIIDTLNRQHKLHKNARLRHLTEMCRQVFGGSLGAWLLKSRLHEGRLRTQPSNSQMIPACDHTGTPLHFHSSTTSGSACWMRIRT